MRKTVYGVRTHFIEAGEGEPPVILIHGGSAGSSGEMAWSDTVPGLAPHFRAIGLDALLFGYTDKPAIDYSFQTLVEHLAGFIDVMGFERVNLVGQLTGAYIAAKYACDYPERVDHLVMINTGTVSRAMGIERGEASEGQRAASRDDGSKEALRGLMDTLMHRKENLTEEMLDAKLALAAQPGLEEAFRSLGAYRANLDQNPNQWQVYDLKERLPKLTVPMCIIWGIEDRWAPVRLGRELHQLLPQAEYHEVPEASHHCFHDQPEIINDLLIRFFQTATAPSRPVAAG
jgi:pimeloyl-ACP methyl ester carboxylesterase